MLVGNAPPQPTWSAQSEFRDAGEARRASTSRKSFGRRHLWAAALPPVSRPAYLPGRLRPAPSPGAFLELPNQHRIPLTWLLENAGPSIRYRT